MLYNDDAVRVTVAGVLAKVADAVPAGSAKLTVNEFVPTAVIAAFVNEYALTDAVSETLSPTAKAEVVGE